MTQEQAQSSDANAIIAQALQDAGVPPADISVPPVTKQGSPVEGTPVPSPYEELKGETKGQPGTEPVAPAKAPESAKPVPDVAVVTPQLSKDEIVTAIAEATSKIQSITDKKINAIQYQMTQTINGLNQFFQSQEETSLAGASPEEQTLKRLDRLEKGSTPKIQINPNVPVDQGAQFYQQLVNFVDAVGLKPDDKRIDWAPDAQDGQTGFNRFLTSIKSSLLADQTKVIKELRDNGQNELLKLRKKTGVDVVSTTPPGGQGLPDIDKMTSMQKLEYGVQQRDNQNLNQ